MARPVYLVEIDARVAPAFARGLIPNASGTNYRARHAVAVDGAKTYTIKSRARKSSDSDGQLFVGVAFYTAADVLDSIGWWSVAGSQPNTTWTQYTNTFGASTARPVPGAAVSMRPIWTLSFASAAGYQDLREVWIEDNAAPGVQLTPDPYLEDAGAWEYQSGAVASWRVDLAATDWRTKTLRYASGGYQTRPTDTPPNTPYPARVRQPGIMRWELPNDLGGVVAVGYGEIVLVNGDGGLSALAYAAMDGAAVRVRVVDDEAALSAATTIIETTADQCVVDRDLARIRLLAPDARLDRPLCSQRYAGNNALPNGVEGSSELAGKVKPQVYGAVAHIEPPCVNTSRLIYQFHASFRSASVSMVRVAGVALTQGALYTSQADMEANAPAAGAFRQWKAGGMFRLGSTPAGVVTCDAAIEPSGLGNPWEVWNVMYQIAWDAGVQGAEFWQSQSTQLPQPVNFGGDWSADQPHVGVWVDDLRTAREALAFVGAGCDTWCGFIHWQGLFHSTTALKFGAEAFAPAVAVGGDAYFDESSILSVKALAPPVPGRGLPTWRVDLGVRLNRRVLSPADAPTLNPATLGYYGLSALRQVAEDSNIQGRHARALTRTLDTAILDTGTEAGYEVTRQLESRRYPRPWFEVELPLDAVRSAVRSYRPRVGGWVELRWPELRVTTVDGITAAAGWFVIMAAEVDLARGRVRLTVRQGPEQTI